MSYADGKVYDIKSAPKDEQLKMIHDFAEGSIQLENFLLTCLKKGVNTVACCAGHEDEKRNPFISFDYNKSSDDEYYNMYGKNFIHYILNQMDNESARIRLSSHDDSMNIYFGFPNQDYSNVFYTVFSNARVPEYVEENEKLTLMTSINESIHEAGLTGTLDYSNGEMFLEISSNNVVLRYDDEKCMDLKLFNEIIQSTGTIQYNACRCDIESLREFSELVSHMKENSIEKK